MDCAIDYTADGVAKGKSLLAQVFEHEAGEAMGLIRNLYSVEECGHTVWERAGRAQRLDEDYLGQTWLDDELRDQAAQKFLAGKVCGSFSDAAFALDATVKPSSIVPFAQSGGNFRTSLFKDSVGHSVARDMQNSSDLENAKMYETTFPHYTTVVSHLTAFLLFYSDWMLFLGVQRTCSLTSC